MSDRISELESEVSRLTAEVEEARRENTRLRGGTEQRERRIASDATEFVRLGCDFCGRAANWFCFRCRSPLCRVHKEGPHDCSPARWPVSDNPAFRPPASDPRATPEARQAIAFQEWVKAKGDYYALDAKELRDEAVKLRKRGEEADARFLEGCADYARGFSRDLLALPALLAHPPQEPTKGEG